MAKIEECSDFITDYIVSFPGIDIGIKETDLLQGTFYLWARVYGPIRLSVYKEMLTLLKRAGGRKVVINVRANEPQAIKFAKFFGFHSVQLLLDTYIMELN